MLHESAVLVHTLKSYQNSKSPVRLKMYVGYFKGEIGQFAIKNGTHTHKIHKHTSLDQKIKSVLVSSLRTLQERLIGSSSVFWPHLIQLKTSAVPV